MFSTVTMGQGRSIAWGCAGIAFGCLALCFGLASGDSTAAAAGSAETPTPVAGKVPGDTPSISQTELLARFSPEQHAEFMRRAIANSRKAGVQYKTGGAFGAVIVNRQGEVLADGVNHVVAQNDPTWHGEMHAIRQACALLKTPKLDGCILYTSAEPCPMCLAAAYWAGLDGIVYGALIEDSKKYGNFDNSFVYEQFQKPTDERRMPQVNLLRPDAVEVWKEYSQRSDKIDN